MEQHKKVLITKTDKNFDIVCERALKDNGFKVVFCEKDGQALLTAMIKEKPEVVIAEAFMPSLDAVSVKRKFDLNENTSAVKYFVMGTSANELLEREIMGCGALYYFLKPFDADYLASVIAKSIGINIKKIEDEDDESEVTNILHQIGVPAHIKGYQYLRDAILLNLEDSTYMSAVTKRLYPDVAKINLTTQSRVERAIRHAIEVAWDRGDVEVLNGYFGYTIHSLRGKPTNSEFIAMISDKMRLAKKRNKNTITA